MDGAQVFFLIYLYSAGHLMLYTFDPVGGREDFYKLGSVCVSKHGAVLCADLGGSSRYSIETFD